MANVNMFNGKVTLRVTKSGKLDKRNKIGAFLEKLVNERVDDALKQNGIQPSSQKPIKEPTPESQAKERRKTEKAKRWITSHMGKAMTGAQMMSAGLRYTNILASGDEAKQNREIFSSGLSALTLGLGTIGGPWGMVASVLISYARGLFGQYIENQIQEKYDTRRFRYKLSNYDLSKYSTQTYNYSQQKWIATDTVRTTNKILGNRNVV